MWEYSQVCDGLRRVIPPYPGPRVVHAPGRYITRCGETVVIDAVPPGTYAWCEGRYENGVRESWRMDGSVFRKGWPSDNDIVRAEG